MDLLFLGTGAHDYSPRLQDEFKDKFDNNARRSSCLLLNGKILIDCGDFALNAMQIAGIKHEDVTHLFITHSHSDHFRPDHITAISQAGSRKLQVYCSAAVASQIVPSDRLSIHVVSRGQMITCEDFKAVPLRSNHFVKNGEVTYHYLFECGGKKLFYGLDGAWLATATANYLHQANLDFFVFDGTIGDREGDYRIFEHNSLSMVRSMIKSLKTVSALSPHCKIYISHIARTLHLPHEETVQLLKDDNISVAYDGLHESC